GLANDHAACEDGGGLTLAQDACAADLDLLGRYIFRKRLFRALDPQIDRTIIFEAGRNRGSKAFWSSRLENGHVRYRPHERQVLDRLVRNPKERGHARQKTDNLDR